MPFVALRREGETPGSTVRTTPRHVRQQANLLVLRGCVFSPHGAAPGSPDIRRLRTVLVNLAAAVGVAEWEGPRG